MVCGGSVHHRCRGSEGRAGIHLTCWCVATRGQTTHIRLYGAPGIGRHSAPATVPDFILGKYLFPTGYSLTWTRTLWERDRETQDQSLLARDGLFHFNSPVSRTAWHSSLLTDSVTPFEKMSLLSLTRIGLYLLQLRDLDCWGHEPIKTTHAGHQGVGHSVAQEQSPRMGTECSRPCLVQLDALGHVLYLLTFPLIVLKWHPADDLT